MMNEKLEIVKEDFIRMAIYEHLRKEYPVKMSVEEWNKRIDVFLLTLEVLSKGIDWIDKAMYYFAQYCAEKAWNKGNHNYEFYEWWKQFNESNDDE